MRLYELPDGVFLNPEHIVFLGASEAPRTEDGTAHGVVVIATTKDRHTLPCRSLDEAQHLLRRIVTELRNVSHDLT